MEEINNSLGCTSLIYIFLLLADSFRGVHCINNSSSLSLFSVNLIIAQRINHPHYVTNIAVASLATISYHHRCVRLSVPYHKGSSRCLVGVRQGDSSCHLPSSHPLNHALCMLWFVSERAQLRGGQAAVAAERRPALCI